MLIYNFKPDLDEENDPATQNISLSVVFPDTNSPIYWKVFGNTIKTLEKLKELDFIFLIVESQRFLCHLVYFQLFYQHEFYNYYQHILDYFHSNGLLLFKKHIIQYKNHKNKSPYIQVRFSCRDMCFTNVYYFRHEVIDDLGIGFIKDYTINEKVYEFGFAKSE